MLPVLFTLHFLGGSARTWDAVAERLAPDVRCVALDLPGFGDAADVPGYSVEAMADAVAAAVRAEGPPASWALAGHSMGAKVATVLARRSEDGTLGFDGLAALVLVAGSPPSPEPMDEAQRATMRGWFAGDAARSRGEAEGYVADNAGDGLTATLAERAAGDVLRANRSAWLAWLDGGSREDWSSRIGVLAVPTLVIAGADDESLGPDAQRASTAPHFSEVRTVALDGAKHLLPLERPDDVARLIRDHLAAARDVAYGRLIDSARVGARTRDAVRARDVADDPAYAPRALDAAGLATLRALAECVIPQSDPVPIDFAARLDRQLADGTGDGWRFAALPPDVAAYRAGLAGLETAARATAGQSFVTLSAARRDEILRAVAAGSAPAGEAGTLDPAQMTAWFEDARGDLVKLYVLHPRTLARIGYGGIANGGDGEPKSGFGRVGPDERERWEPLGAVR